MAGGIARFANVARDVMSSSLTTCADALVMTGPANRIDRRGRGRRLT